MKDPQEDAKEKLIGQRIDDEEYGTGTIIAESADNVTIGLDSPGARMLVVPKAALERVSGRHKKAV